MSYRKISASFIFSAHTGFLKNGILIIDKDSIITDLIDTGGDLKEIANLEHYNGILTPGFVNTQCPINVPNFSRQTQVGDDAVICGQIIRADQIHGSQKMTIEKDISTSGIFNLKDSLLILREMYAIQQHDPLIDLKDLLIQATLQAAKDQGIEGKLGSFEKGKQPGVYLIEQVDLQKLKLKEGSRITKIL